jgi:hypothetical protein
MLDMHTRSIAIVAAALGLTAASLPVSAHHSFAAEFDSQRPLTVTGVVHRLEWTNPHARLVVDVTDDKGAVVRWDFELGPPNGLMRRGWNRNSLKQGHKVTVQGFHSKTQATIANARSVKLPDGREVFAGSSFDAGEAGQ